MWRNSVAVVTGASSGIGAQIAKDLVTRLGLTTVGVARRRENIERLKEELPEGDRSKLLGFECDVTDGENIKEVFSAINKKFGGVDILINNAGMWQPGSLYDDSMVIPMQATIQTNLMGLINCTREVVQSIRDRPGAKGYVIHINSIIGHSVPIVGDSLNTYSASKFGVTALTEIYRLEFMRDKLPIRVSSISPGVVDTTLVPDVFKSVHLVPQDVSNAVQFCLETAPHVEVHDLIVKPFRSTL